MAHKWIDRGSFRLRSALPGRASSVLRSALVRIGSMGCTVIVTVLLAKRLGPEEFGAYSVALLAVFLGAAVAAAGLGRVGLRGVTGLLTDGQPVAAAGLTRSLLPVFAVSGPLGFAVATAFCAISMPRSLVPLQSCVMVGVAAVGAGILMATADLFRAWERPLLADATTGPNGFVPSVLFLVPLLALPNEPLTNVLLLQMLAFVVPAVLALWWLGRHSAGVVVKRVGEWLRESRVFLWVSLAAITNGLADLWVASTVLGLRDVGHYAGAARIALLVTIPQNIAQMAHSREVVRLLRLGNHAELQRTLRRHSTFTLLVASPALVALLAPRAVLREVLGAQYESAAPVLVALTIAQLVNVATGLCGLVLAMSGNERFNLVVSVAASGLTVVGGLLAGSWFGLAGLGVASALATGSMFVLLLIGARRRVGIWTHPDVFPPLRSSIARGLT